MPTLVTQLFKKGDLVLESGMYVCRPCGFVERFEAGARFTECVACFAGTELGPEGFRENEQEFWQYLG